MKFDQLIRPDIAREILSSTGLVRIPFSTLNSSVRDMLSAYASDLLPADTYDSMQNVCYAGDKIDVHTSYFYIFTTKQYNAFLKLISKENSLVNGCLTCTTMSEVIFSTQEDCSYDKCPTFSIADADAFEAIENTLYHKFFSNKHIHLCKLNTRRQMLGKRPVKLTEVCLFIPE